MNRVILHADCNSFYVSCEVCYRPELRGLPVVVGGDPEARHGIVLAKSDAAKAAGIKTGHVLWQAKSLCKDLIILPPDYRKYLRFSKMTREIFGDYSDRVEPFGLDEAWIDVSGSSTTIEDGERIAHALRERIKEELGITVSVGVGDNKIMAKLGSDMKKPDAVTVVHPDHYTDQVWPLPVGELLYVGPATETKLKRLGLYTIGDLARMQPHDIHGILGKNGVMLWSFANGLDQSPVSTTGYAPDIKSIGNSTTTPADMVCDEDVMRTIWVLSEAVAERLREHGFRARTVQISVRDNALKSYERQIKLKRPTQIAAELARASMSLFRANHRWDTDKALRSIGVRGADLETDTGAVQLSLFAEEIKREKTERIEHAMDEVRKRFGHFAMMRGSLLKEPVGRINPKEDHTIHPVSFLR